MYDKKTQLEFIDREIKSADALHELFTDLAIRFTDLGISLRQLRKSTCAQTCEKPVN